MKTFKQHISEDSAKTAAAVGTTADGKSVEDSQIGAFNVQDEDVLKVVNGLLVLLQRVNTSTHNMH